MVSAEKVKAIYKVTDTHIYGFFNEHRYLSNFHLHSIMYEDILYPSNENAYQASKAQIVEERFAFAAYTPSQAKSAGRTLTLRGDWLKPLHDKDIMWYKMEPLIEQVRDKIMYDINVIKFSDPTLRDMLLATGDKYLEETNWWKDNYWGAYNGKGLNKLGRILMKVREEAK